MAIQQTDLVEVRRAKGKGRGVFARCDIKKGTVIEHVPLLIATWDEIDESELADYAYTWTEKTAAIALGYGSLYNHSFNPNAKYEDLNNRTKMFTAIKNIKAGEEVTINYNADPKDKTNVFNFEVLE